MDDVAAVTTASLTRVHGVEFTAVRAAGLAHQAAPTGLHATGLSIVLASSTACFALLGASTFTQTATPTAVADGAHHQRTSDPLHGVASIADQIELGRLS